MLTEYAVIDHHDKFVFLAGYLAAEEHWHEVMMEVIKERDFHYRNRFEVIPNEKIDKVISILRSVQKDQEIDASLQRR